MKLIVKDDDSLLNKWNHFMTNGKGPNSQSEFNATIIYCDTTFTSICERNGK